ncbi:Alanine racemase, N-terminal domain [Bacillus sp. 491mf]|nr:Alanine racemase, N-terminal domain [Bacillus sp. 491mf]
MGKSPFYRDAWAEVNLDAIYENVTRIQSIILNGVEIFSVVKANAYGHWAVEVAMV